ncbi:uncharacterized protein LOC144106345 isoform X5 [Amblyomma americanum]
MSWSLEGRSIETWQPCCEDEEESLPSQERATSQEIELKEDIKEALKANGIYSNDKLYDTMAVLEILGVKAAQHFELLETEDLVSRGMPPETADTLLKEFGTYCWSAPHKGDADCTSGPYGREASGQWSVEHRCMTSPSRATVAKRARQASLWGGWDRT